MANWDILKSAIAGVIKTNGNQEITGQLLQSVLSSIVSSVGENATFAGIATPDTNPGAPDGPVFYLAFEKGEYPNFGLVDKISELTILKNENGKWIAKGLKTPIISESVAVCDFSIADENGNSVARFFEGHVETKKFNSKTTIKSVSVENDTLILII